MRKIYIYTLTDPETDEIRYVGKTININKRLKHHIRESKNRTYYSANWIKSLVIKGLEPIINIVEECDELNWRERETYWISFYRENGKLTNILSGGEGGATFGRLGTKWSDEQHINNKLARTGVSIKQSDKDGKRKDALRKFYDKNKKIVLQYDLDGDLIKEWESAVDAGKELNISYSDINRACKKENLTTSGFQWRYKDSEIKIGKYVKPDNSSNLEIIQMTKDGEQIKEYKSIMDASRQTGILNTSINNCLSGRSQSAGGYKWKYKWKYK